MMHPDPFALNSHRFNTCLTLSISRGTEGTVIKTCVCVSVHACVVKAERKQGTEMVQIKPSTVYLRSQVAFGLIMKCIHGKFSIVYKVLSAVPFLNAEKLKDLFLFSLYKVMQIRDLK